MSNPQPASVQNHLLQAVLHYFRPPAHSFWAWADKGKVIEWFEGGTICYREELVELMKDIAHDGLPPLHDMLLVLSACKPEWSKEKKLQMDAMLGYVADEAKERIKRNAIKRNTPTALALLDRINQLPEHLRKGDARGLLIRTLFANGAGKLDFNMASAMLHEFNSGRMDSLVFKDGILPREPVLEAMAENLARAGERFATVHSLELALRTGVQDMPGDLPEVEVPENRNTDLLQQLSEDPRTAGLAHLTQHLVAALNIPMHAQGQSDQSFGGVSDISNRGNLDRLLLSELAHDDLSLMARLANNEALYLRREELPDDLHRQRILLVDTTLKMWGIPRIFAIAAALACTRNNKLNAQIDAYALGGRRSKNIELDTKEGIINAMEQLDPALHCGHSLINIMNETPGSDRDEYFLITGTETFQTPAFQQTLSELKRPLSFLIAVGREGELQFFEFVNRRRKLVSEARFDINALLRPKTKASKRNKGVVSDMELPAFLQEFPSPLHFPASKMIFNQQRAIEIAPDGVLAVTADQRVLYWSDRYHGAREIMSFIPNAWYSFGMNKEEQVIYILMYRQGWSSSTLYQIAVKTLEETALDVPLSINNTDKISFSENEFHVYSTDKWSTLNASNGMVTVSTGSSGHRPPHPGWYMGSIKKTVNNGYTVLNSIPYIFVNADNELTLGTRHLALLQTGLKLVKNHQHPSKKEHKLRPKKHGQAQLPYPNSFVKFHRFEWADGSLAIVDSRGLLHLISSDKTIPEITIVLIESRLPTAAWASDGRVCGSAYFTGVNNAESSDVAGFYNNYIQRFIDALQ